MRDALLSLALAAAVAATLAACSAPAQTEAARPSRRPAATRTAGRTASRPAARPAARPAPATPSGIGGPRISASDVERGVHTATNRARQRRGAGTLALDGPLSAVARRHSADMARRDFFDHHAPDGSDANARAARDGLACRVEVGRRVYTGYAENLAQVWTYSGWTDRRSGGRTERTYSFRTLDGIVAETVDGWLNSPGHRRNLLTAHASREGVGVHVGADGAVYVTQMLC